MNIWTLPVITCFALNESVFMVFHNFISGLQRLVFVSSCWLWIIKSSKVTKYVFGAKKIDVITQYGNTVNQKPQVVGDTWQNFWWLQQWASVKKLKPPNILHNFNNLRIKQGFFFGLIRLLYKKFCTKSGLVQKSKLLRGKISRIFSC